MNGCTAHEIDAAESAVGVPLPGWLRRFYEARNGHFDDGGQWWVVWPLDRVVDETLAMRAAGRLDPALVAFGDDGAGDPFCIERDTGDDVVRWSMVCCERTDEVAPDAFLAEWVT